MILPQLGHVRMLMLLLLENSPAAITNQPLAQSRSSTVENSLTPLDCPYIAHCEARERVYCLRRERQRWREHNPSH
jgi:hypothetical protein